MLAGVKRKADDLHINGDKDAPSARSDQDLNNIPSSALVAEIPGDDGEDIDDLLGQEFEPEGSSVKKEKAVKVKKIFLRILRKVLDVPQDSPMLRVWRDNRVAKKSGKHLPGGWYGIEVMDVEEVDSTLRKLLPHATPATVGSQDPRDTMADLLGVDRSMAEEYITLKKGRYRLNEAQLNPEAKQRVQILRAEAKRLHVEMMMSHPPGGNNNGMMQSSSSPFPPQQMGFPGQPQSQQSQQPNMSPHQHYYSSQNPIQASMPAAGNLTTPVVQPSATETAVPKMLKCLDCHKAIPCTCPLVNRLSVRPHSSYQEAVMINKIGETFQHLWEVSDPLQIEKLDELTKNVCKVMQYAIHSVETGQTHLGLTM